MVPKRISTTRQSKTGRNERFRDNYTHAEMTRNQLVKKIKGGDYPNYTVKKINNLDTPVSKPDNSKNNNLN